MKLSELIRYRNQLEAMTTSTAVSAAENEISKILHTVKNCPVSFEDQLFAMTQQQTAWLENFAKFDVALTALKDQVNEIIEEQGKFWFAESAERYHFDVNHATTEHFLNRKTSLPTIDIEYFASRLGTYASWKYPGLLLKPALNNFIHGMVCFDPLYIVDRLDDFLWPCQVEFPEQYRRRLRPVVINENNDNPLVQLPENQFGIALAFDYFNFMPMEIVVVFLQQIFNKLRPGGVLCMTFNDCDTEKAMKLVEQSVTSYIPRRKLLQHIKQIGYEVAHQYNNDSPLTWLELRKPGCLESLRGGQVLAQVRPKPAQN